MTKKIIGFILFTPFLVLLICAAFNVDALNCAASLASILLIELALLGGYLMLERA